MLLELNTKAIEAVGHWIAGNLPGAQRIDARDLAACPLADVRAGWTLPTLDSCDAILLLDGAFPYSLPRIMLANPTPEMSLWPHVERDGKLCLATSASGVDSRNPVALVQAALHEAATLIRGNFADANRADFQADFSLYWFRGSSGTIETLLRSEPPSRIVSALVEGRLRLVAENEEEGLSWLRNRFGSDVSAAVQDAAFVWLEELPEPNDYPGSPAELRQLVLRHSREGIGILDKVITADTRVSYIVLGGEVDERKVLAAVSLINRPSQRIPGLTSQPKIRGFRPGRAPSQIVALHKISERLHVKPVNDAVTRLPVSYRTFKEKEVAVIGCGSLGSGIVRQLAMSGVSALTLVDPEKLDWANISRHELGAPAVGTAKVSALAASLTANFPEIRKVRPIEADWRDAYATEPDLFNGCSLIISATGAWNPEVALDDLRCMGAVACPVVYGWLENRAAAAHALALAGPEVCFRCGFTDNGRPVLPATLWPEQDVDPRCGGGISLYSAIDLGYAVSLVSGLAVDLLTGTAAPPVWRTWLSPVSSLTANGGTWNPAWIERRGGPELGGRLTAGEWIQRHDCNCGLVGQ